VQTPPAVWFEVHGDAMHDYKDVESSFPGNEPARFVAAYRKAGGDIALEYFTGGRHAGHSPDPSPAGNMFERMVGFVGMQIKVELVGSGLSFFTKPIIRLVAERWVS
jgi:acetyl esterase